MGRIRQYADKYAAEDFRKEVRTKQGIYDLMSKSALAEQADIPRTTVVKRLADPSTMTFGEFQKLKEAIHPDPGPVLAVLGYSKKEIRKFAESLLRSTGAAMETA